MTFSQKILLAVDEPLGNISGFSGLTGAGAAVANAPGRLAAIFSTLFSLLTIFAGFSFLIWFIIGAITWITSGHDPNLLKKAQGQMTTAAIGLIAVILTFPIAYILSQLTGLDVLNPENIISDLLPR